MVIRKVTFNSTDNLSTFEALAQEAIPARGEFAVRIVLHKKINPPATIGDPFLAAFLLPCMFLGEALEIEAPVSLKLLQGLDTIQAIFKNWYPGSLSRVHVRAKPITTSTAAESGKPSAAACFFSGGVDSWYSVLTHLHEVSALITVKGFDIPYNDVSVWDGLVKGNGQIAAELGAEFVAVETNLRDCLDPNCANLGKLFADDFWGKYLHGAFLAAVGLCLQSHFRDLIVPSSYSYVQLHPWGTHPLVDPLWSTAGTHFRHDGCGANRMEKLLIVSKSKTALKNLRVCFSYTPDRYNCCECEKCRRTMLALHLLGVLDQASSFDKPLNLHALTAMMLSPGSEVWYQDMLNEARARENHEVIDVLRIILGEKFSLQRAWVRLTGQLHTLCRKTIRASGI